MTITLPHLQKVVAQAFSMSVERMISGPRIAPVVTARQAAMLLARTVAGESYPVIGRAFNRNHGSVITGIRSLRRKMEADEALRTQVAQIEAALTGQTPAPQVMHECPMCHQTVVSLVERNSIAAMLDVAQAMIAAQAKALRS